MDFICVWVRPFRSTLPPSFLDCLLQVRPFLVADGGNVEVEDVSSGVVFLRLEGACGTCSSSATTMRLGIEGSLRATFGAELKEVVQV